MPEQFVISKIPEALDLNEWVQFTLDSKDDIDRQLALQELFITGLLPDLHAKIVHMASKDPSPVCRELASCIIKMDKSRDELYSHIRGLEITPNFIYEILGDLQAIGKSIIGQLIRKAPEHETLILWRRILSDSTNPRLIEIALIILAKFGIVSDADMALTFLSDDDPDIVCAALSLLQKQNIVSFKVNVKSCLTSQLSKIQIHAIGLLRQVDCVEAVKYIKAFLLHRDPIVRQQALRELMLINFKQVENLFLHYLSKEVKTLLIVKSGFVVAFNPHPDFALKIYDIMLVSSGLKKHILQLILKQSISSVEISGMLIKPFDEYVRELKQKLSNRRTEVIIGMATRDLSSDEPSIRLSAVHIIGQYIEHSSVQKILEQHSKIENDYEVKTCIQMLLKDETIENEAETREEKLAALEDKAKGNRFPNTEDFLLLPFSDQSSILDSIQSQEEYLEIRHTITEILNKKCRKKVLLKALRLIDDFGSKDDSSAVYPLIDASEPAIKAGALKALGKIDIELLLPFLNKYLTNDDPRIKIAAFGVYLLADKEAAVQYLTSILKSGNIPSRNLGVSLLPQLDYATAEPILWALLKRERNHNLLMTVSYMIAANPTHEGLIRLFGFSHDKNGELKLEFKDLWNIAMISASKAFIREIADIEAECWEAYKAQCDDLTPEKLSYSYKSVFGDEGIEDISKASKTDENIFEMFVLHFYNYKAKYIVAAFIFFPILYFIYVVPESQPSHSSIDKSTSSRSDIHFFASKNESSSQDRQNRQNSQVGTQGWTGYIKSGARDTLSGSAYTELMKTASEEVKTVRKEFKQAETIYFMQQANDESQPEEVRAMAAALSNQNYSRAMEAFNSGNMREAEANFEQCVDDSQLNIVGKCMALTSLMEITESRGDSKNWNKWRDLLLKEMRQMPEYKNIESFEDFSETLEQIFSAGRHFASGNSDGKMIDLLKKGGESDSSAREALSVLKNLSVDFEKEYGGSKY